MYVFKSVTLNDAPDYRLAGYWANGRMDQGLI